MQAARRIMLTLARMTFNPLGADRRHRQCDHHRLLDSARNRSPSRGRPLEDTDNHDQHYKTSRPGNRYESKIGIPHADHASPPAISSMNARAAWSSTQTSTTAATAVSPLAHATRISCSRSSLSSVPSEEYRRSSSPAVGRSSGTTSLSPKAAARMDTPHNRQKPHACPGARGRVLLQYDYVTP